MALSIKNPEIEHLVRQLAMLTGNTKTGAVGQAVRRELERLRQESSSAPKAYGRLTLRLETELPSVSSRSS